ncbi:MAG: NAD(P)H-dependent oxidoreductase [Planctomycetes bacterium]|nr:NAD(P)H-dependent oxidoreductase [Planctomycetota bacterium]
MKSKILAFSGSARRGSANQQLVESAATVLRGLDADVTIINLRDFDMPLYNQDVEAEGFPDAVLKLKEIANDHDGYLVSSPEYNGSISPLLKNAIDWLSRPAPDEPRMAAFAGKTGAIMSASPGPMGGIRALPHVRQIFSGLGVTLVSNQLALGSSGSAFNEDGSLSADRNASTLSKICQDLLDLTNGLKSVR